MLVSAPGGLTATAATERSDCRNVLESADYADYADNEKREAGTGRRRQEQHVGEEHGANTSSFLLLPCFESA